jgi:plastocyanin
MGVTPVNVTNYLRKYPGRLLTLGVLSMVLGMGVLMAAGVVETGAVEGVVNLSGAVREASPAKAAASAIYQRGAAGGAAPLAPADPPVAVVYAEARDAATTAAVAAAHRGQTPAEAQIVQKGMRFIPALQAVETGATVTFPNQDDFYHNVFSYSAAKTFDLGRYRKDESPAKVVFDQPGVVKIFCEIHEHMRCVILVLKTPYFTTTDAAGNFHLSGLPPGAYTLTAWVNDKTIWSRPFDVHAGETAKADLTAPVK